MVISIITRFQYLQLPVPTKGRPRFPDIWPLIFALEEVANQLQNIDSSKATCPDEVPARILKETSLAIAPIVTFSISLLTQVPFPITGPTVQ